MLLDLIFAMVGACGGGLLVSTRGRRRRRRGPRAFGPLFGVVRELQPGKPETVFAAASPLRVIGGGRRGPGPERPGGR